MNNQNNNVKDCNCSSEIIKLERRKCWSCGEEYPEQIQQRLLNFKFKLRVECPTCNSGLIVGDFF